MLTTRRNLNLSRLSFDTETDELSFSEELETLLNHSETKHFVRPNTVQALHNLYLTLLGKKSVFELVFYNTIGQYSLLKDYFLQFIDNAHALPEKPLAIEVFIILAAKNQNLEYLFRLLEADILNDYRAEYLVKLLTYTFEQLITFIDLHFCENLSFEDKRLSCELIELLPVDLITDSTGEDIYFFFKEIYPVFCVSFSEELADEGMFTHLGKIVDWYLVWQKHKTKSEEEILLLNDDYYQMDFVTIIKYVPNILWWQNGIHFRDQVKKFAFGSPEFVHLACGGSIRQALPTQPFSRPMAKIFSKLSYDFDQTGIDVYLYCYSKSLHSGDLLTKTLQRFIGNYPNAQRMKVEFDKWRPVIQKLANPDFEQLQENRAMELLGYLTHILRDNPNFTAKKQSLSDLLILANEYYHQISLREQARERERRLRNKRQREAEKAKNSWAASNRVKSLRLGRYMISELTSRDELRQEGNVMGHCVRTYADSCKQGIQSIWSLRELENSSWKSRVTIALSRNLYITEARARFNALPKKGQRLLVKKWAEHNRLPLSRVLEDWDF